MRRLFILILILFAAYVAYPYWTLYRLDHAILNNNAEALQSIVDFPAIRASLKDEVQDGVLAKTDELAKTKPAIGEIGRALAEAFGPSIVGGTIDGLVTPEAILENPTVVERREKDEGFDGFVRYAFFSGPTKFRVDLKDPDEANAPTLTAYMTFTGFRWRVSALNMPPLEALLPNGN